MFQALCAHHQEVKIVLYSITTPVGGRPVHTTATYRCGDTRCCTIQFWPPDDEHSSARNMQRDI